jgi:hypothetical protein
MYHIDQLTMLYKPWIGKMTSPGGQDTPTRDWFIVFTTDNTDQEYFTEHTVPYPYESIKSQI